MFGQRVALGAIVAIAAMLAVAPRSAHATMFGEVTCTRCVMDVAGARFTVNGKIVMEPLSVDVVGYTDTWKFGSLALRDVVATARDRGNTIQACIAGKLGESRLVGCSTLPRSLDRLKELTAADITWRLAGKGGTGRGAGHLAWDGPRGLRLARGHVEVELPPRTHGLGTTHAKLVADLAGTLSPLDLQVTGNARIGELDAAPFHLEDVELPVAVRVRTDRGTVMIAPQGQIVARAGEATIGLGSRVLRIWEPTLAIHDAQPFAWSALLDQDQILAWTAITGLPVELDAGSATVRIADGGVHVDHTRFDALGANVALDAFDIRPDSPSDAMMHIRGLPLARVLHLVTRDRIEGNGTLDADLALHRDEHGLAIKHGTLHARSGGELHVRDFAWTQQIASSVMGVALHRRVATTLADFNYDRLALIVRPRGSEPESMLALHGSGKHVPQELDITVNLHGARSAARWLVSRVYRSE